MIKDLRNTFKQTAIYGVSNLLVKATGLVLLPIYTSSLSTEEYGMLIMLEILTQFFVDVISFSIPTAMLRLGSDTEDEGKQNKIYFTALVMLLAMGLTFLLVFIPCSGLFSVAFFDTSKYAGYFTVIFISIVLEILGLLPMQLLRLREKSTKYISFFGLKLAAIIGFVWYFVTIQQMGVYGAILGVLCSNIVLLLATFTFQFKNSSFKFDKGIAKEMFQFGGPLVFTTISAVLLTISDRLIIKIYGQLSDVGIYSLAYKVGSLSNLLILGSFSLGFLPIAFKKFGQPGFDRFYSKMFTYFIGITVLLTLIVSLFSKEGIKLISSDNPDFWIAVILVPFIAYMFIFKALNNYLAYVFLLIKRTKFYARITVFGVLLNIALNFLLIPNYGMYGAIAATGLSYIAMGLYTLKLAQTHYPLHYEFNRIAGLMVGCAVFITIGIYFNDQSLVARIAIKTLSIIGFAVYLFYGIADPAEREKVSKAWKVLREGDIKKLLSEWTSS